MTKPTMTAPAIPIGLRQRAGSASRRRAGWARQVLVDGRHRDADPRVEARRRAMSTKKFAMTNDRGDEQRRRPGRSGSRAGRSRAAAGSRRPGSPKMISAIAAPLIRAPTSKPATVTTGMSAFRSACLRSTVRARRALGPRRAHVVEVQHLEHRRAHHPHHDREREDGDRDRRQDELLEVLAPGPRRTGRTRAAAPSGRRAR